MPENIQNILRELKAGLRRIYGEQLHSVILFGSYARGDAHPPDSDIDVMIVLNEEFTRRDVEQRSSEFIANLCLEHDVLISRIFISAREYRESKMPLLLNVRREGVIV